MKTKMAVSLITCLLLTGFNTSVNAGSITSASIIETSTQFDSGYGLQYIIDKSGLYNPIDSQFDKYTSGKTDFDSYVNSTKHHFAFIENEWFSPNTQTSGYIIFDLGNVYDIDKFALWNEDSHGIANFKVFTAIELVDDQNWDFALSDHASNNGWETDYGADTFSFVPNTIARYVKIEILDVYSNEHNSFQHASIGEIAFSTNPVPEPATLLLLGTGLVGLLGMKRKKQ